MRLILTVGTRPEIIKMAPIYEIMDRVKEIEVLLVHTGQHYDWEMSEVFFKDLGVPEPDVELGVGSGSQLAQTSGVIDKMERVFRSYEPDGVLSVGDTNSVLGTAIASSKMEIPFIHVESGLRSYDFTMPEEINRRIADHLASINFSPTLGAFSNLLEEGYPVERVFLSGNTIVDAVMKVQELVGRSNILRELGISEDELLMTVTVHRKENTDYEHRMLGILKAIKELDDLTIVWPLHPRTLKRLKEYDLLRDLKAMDHVILTDPLGYLDFLKLLSSSHVVATDSGGVQEESVTLRVPCVILRNNTERPELIELGIGRIAGTNPASIISSVRDFVYSEKMRTKLEKLPNPYGDGTAAKVIVDVLRRIWDLRAIRHESPYFRGGSPHYIAFKVPENLVGITVARFQEMTGYEVVSIYNASGKAVFFDLSKPFLRGEVVRVRGDPYNFQKVVKLMRERR